MTAFHGKGQDSEAEGEEGVDRRGFLTAAAGVGAAVLGAITTPVKAAHAWADQRTIGEIPASGLIFKDTIKIQAFKDPKVEGVELYITDFERPITERLQKDFFSDPTQASVAAARTGTVRVSKDIYKGKDGEEVFEQARSLLFKSLRVRRVYDEEAKVLVYVSYSTRLNKEEDTNKSRFKTTTAAIGVDEVAE